MNLLTPSAPAVVAPNVSLGLSPMVQPITKLAPGVHPGFVVGETDRIHDSRTVAWAIRCRVNLKVGDREFSDNLCLHEIVLYRRFYEESAGSIALDPSWPPGLARLVPLTQEQLQVELKRFKETFIVPSNNSTLDITDIYLGTEPAEALRRLHDLMKRQLVAWGKLIIIATARVQNVPAGLHPEILFSLACDHITAKELEDLAAMGDPGKVNSDGIQFSLPEVANPAAKTGGLTIDHGSEASPGGPSLADLEAQANAEVDAQPDAIDALLSRLRGAGLDDQQALALASLVDMGVDPASLADDDIVRALGSKAKLAAAKRALKG